MPISKPMQVMTLRMSDEEKARLQLLARECNVTLSHALREGARLYLEDARCAAGPKGARPRAIST